MKKTLLSLCAITLFTAYVMADSYPTDYINPISTSMPSLTITPDARAAGMGDLGVATDADLNSQYWNPAKYAFLNCNGAISANYTPWLRSLVGDIDLAYISGFYNFGDRAGGLGASLTYFSMGAVQMMDLSGSVLQEAHPNEWAIDVSYFRKLHEYVSMSVALRFLYSDMNNGINSSVTNSANEMHAAWTMAADIALFYHQPIQIPMGTSYFNLGFSLNNLGGKMSYTDDISNFIPTTMRIGAAYELPFDKYNTLTFNLEADKYLVPTKKSSKAETLDRGDEEHPWGSMEDQEYTNLTSVKGIFQSFGDAPYGAREEFDEVRWGAGLEYSYNKQFFARFGYSYENFHKGNRNYLTWGVGFHLSLFSLDFSHCIALASTNPLHNTMRFTVGFDLGGIKDLVNNKK